MDVLSQIKPLTKNRLHEEVVWKIKNMIAQGYYEPGDRLPSSRELAEKFSVSRAVISEAMTLLEVMGLVNIEPGKGTFISDVTNSVETEIINFIMNTEKWLVEDLTELRLILEPQIAWLAAQRRSDLDIKKMEQIQEEMEQSTQKGKLGVIESMNFHLMVAASAKNQVVVRILLALNLVSRESREGSMSRKDRPKQAAEEHMAILKAIKNRDGDRASFLMKQHLQALAEYITDINKGS